MEDPKLSKKVLAAVILGWAGLVVFVVGAGWIAAFQEGYGRHTNDALLVLVTAVLWLAVLGCITVLVLAEEGNDEDG